MSPLRCAVLLVLFFPPACLADEIFFKNGDRLTGQILSTDAGKMKFKSPVLGEVQFKLADLESFKSDQPVDIRLKDGTHLKAPVKDAADGEITIAPGAPAARTIKTNQVNAVNPNEGWTGLVAAGANFARGNTYADEVNLNADVEKRSLKNRYSAGVTYHFGRQKQPDTGEKRTTTDNWNVRAKYDYFYSEQLYGYANAKAEQDNIARLELRITPGIGLGYQWYDTPNFKLSGEAGLTYVYEHFNPQDSANDGFRDTKEFLGARLAYKAQWKLNDRLMLFHSSEWLPSLQDLESYLVNSDAGMRVDLMSRMFLEYKLQFQYNSMPAPGASDTDLRHILSLGWQF